MEKQNHTGDRYRKLIQVSDTGMITAEVFREFDGKRVGLRFFDRGLIESIVEGGFKTEPASMNKRFDKAHKWVKEYIEVCERQERVL